MSSFIHTYAWLAFTFSVLGITSLMANEPLVTPVVVRRLQGVFHLIAAGIWGYLLATGGI